jgi:hypothetical protein
MALRIAAHSGEDSKMICPPQLRPIALVREYGELIQGLRDRAEELNVSRETLDAVSGLQSGYTAKLLVGLKGLGRVSLGPLLGSMGLVIVLAEDQDALARVRHRLVPRHPQGHAAHSNVRHVTPAAP